MGKPEIILAKSAGFCFGVERAVNTVYEESVGNGPIYTFGPIIHNREVVADLEKRGVHVVESEEEIRALREGTIIIRSHGVSRRIDSLIRESGLRCIDATCPFVKRIHRTVEEQSASGKRIVIVGSPDHPEVAGIMGWSSAPASVIRSVEEAEKFEITPGERAGEPGLSQLVRSGKSKVSQGEKAGEPGIRDGGAAEKPAFCQGKRAEEPADSPDREKKDLPGVCVVAQTTFNANKFQDIVAILEKKSYNTLCVNTICNATHERQSEAKEIARKADIMIVIGDRSSSNSAKLYEICRRECPKTYFIQTWNDLNLTLTGAEKVIGITAGASTPKNIIEEVYNHVRADL